MRTHLIGVYLVVFTSLAIGQDQSPIRLPVRELPTPAPAPPANLPIALPGDTWYVVESDVECLTFASPGQAITITKESGPIRLRGRFVGGSDRVESKLFTGPFVYLIEANRPGQDELLIVPIGAKRESEARRVSFTIGTIVPPVPPKPVEPINDAPIKADGLHVLIVYEPNVALPASQSAILTGQATRELLNSKCTTDARGLKAYRLFPVGIEFGDEHTTWKEAYARKRTSHPWVIISNGQSGFEGPLPKSEREFAELVAKYAK